MDRDVNAALNIGRRASSRKTRIETRYKYIIGELNSPVEERVPGKQGLKLDRLLGSAALGWCRRASSRKTRIETYEPFDLPGCYHHVEERVPGKQGLKLSAPGGIWWSPKTSKSEFQENKD